jgi:hypothetical protein
MYRWAPTFLDVTVPPIHTFLGAGIFEIFIRITPTRPRSRITPSGVLVGRFERWVVRD